MVDGFYTAVKLCSDKGFAALIHNDFNGFCIIARFCNAHRAVILNKDGVAVAEGFYNLF